MAHAQVCPICHGTGKNQTSPCHGCGGRGWVEVRDEHPIYPVDPYFPRPRKRIIWI